jgi:hypothetical protein
MKKIIGLFLLICSVPLMGLGLFTQRALQAGMPGNPVTEIRPVKVFILAGQSNAVGYNHIKEFRGSGSFLTENSANLAKVMFWPGSNARSGFENAWTKLQPGVSEISPGEPYKDGCFGPEIGFALTVQKLLPGDKIAIIKYAEGGTGISRSRDYTDYIPALKDFNDKGRNWHPPVEGKEGGLLYENLTNNIRKALESLNNQGLKYEISGFLWMQGEHEAGISKKMAEDYGKLLSLFRESVRHDLNIKKLPFIVGEINSHTWAFAEIARKQQALACEKDPRSLLIKTTDLSRGSIGGAAHFDAEGMMILGNRFAQGMHTFLYSKAIDPNHPAISFRTLLEELTDRSAIAQWPSPEFRSLQASSYNRASVAPDQPGWFADSDGVSWIREEMNNGKKEFVIMEHDGPGCITRMWTPFFYYGFNNRTGPNVKIYLDGNKIPVIDENFIALLTGKGTIHPPFTGYTARAGVCFLPIPFSKSCKITLDDKAFYNIINYRAYQMSQHVQTFSKDTYNKSAALLNAATELLSNPKPYTEGWQKSIEKTIKPNDSLMIPLPEGNHAIRQITIRLNPKSGLQTLRSTILKITFDGKQTVWCPVGDFFCSPDTINPFTTKNLSVSKQGQMTCNWVMPYSSGAQLTLINLQDHEVTLSVGLNVGDYSWNDHSMYFHTNWADVGPLPGNHFFDLNFINITGKGVLAGDALTVLSPDIGWWGEGDEKIFIDEIDINRRFPSHFGTGTEDYYGWAGGVNPTGKDTFSIPIGSNVRIGNSLNPKGYNICFRNRILDDIPFNNRLVFDMEASPGTDIRHYWNLLAYSMVTYWYGMPDAKSNRAPQRDRARQKLISVSEIERMQQLLKDSVITLNSEKLEKLIRDSDPAKTHIQKFINQLNNPEK